MTITHDEAASRIEDYLRRDAILRGEWFDGTLSPNGYERACLLVAAVPEAGLGGIPACPSSLMPEWMARLTTLIDDAGSKSEYPAKIGRYASCLRRSAVLTPEAWSRLDYKVRRIALLEARKHCPVTETAVLAAVDAVVVLLDRAIRGDKPTTDEWRTAASSASSASSEEALTTEAWVAWSASTAAGSASEAAAAFTATWSASVAAAVASASDAAAEASSDRMIAAIFDAWDEEIEIATQHGDNR